MREVLHVSIRVTDPVLSASMFAELTEGKVNPTPLNVWGVVCVHTSDEDPSWLVNMLEFWPADKHWHQGALVDVDVKTQRSYCHVAFITDKSNAQIREIAHRYGATVNEEERGMPTPIPVVYDDLGNYFEFFPRKELQK
jgi:hypothetical protein